jgi:hypothetical protein
MTEVAAHEFYKDPEHLAVAGPGERPPQPLKSGLIPVRFTPDTITAVKRVAKQDGVTVSTWIRRLVGRELQRRLPSITEPTTEAPIVRIDYADPFGPRSETYPDQELVAAICLYVEAWRSFLQTSQLVTRLQICGQLTPCL